MKSRKLQYRTIVGRELVHEVDVTGRPEREVEKITLGMLRNMRDDLFVDDTALHEDSGEVVERHIGEEGAAF